MMPAPEIIMYQTESGQTAVEVIVQNDTVWLSLNQLADLFGRDKSVISRHLKAIFTSQELDYASTVAKFATVQQEGKREVKRQVEFYNLEVIISLGFRINSKTGVQFRQWANRILKEYLIRGYSLNENKLKVKGLEELEDTLFFLSSTLNQPQSLDQESLHIIENYAPSWKLLLQYDHKEMILPSTSHLASKSLSYDFCKVCILGLKEYLIKKKEATDIFGIEKDQGLKAILGNIDQTFDSHPLYPSVEEKAAHLLYFLIKDHPFSDGNKRIGSFLFLLYLRRNLLKIHKINESTLVALALLVAESRPSDKDILIPLVVNLIT